MKRDPIFTAKKPALAVDVILFTIKDKDLQVGLIQRDEEPYHGKPALPGRMVRYDEPIETTAKVALQLKGGIDPKTVFLEQLYTFGQDLKRDTRMRVITIVYYGLVDSSQIDFKQSKFLWHSVYNLPHLAFDHTEIISYAIQRLRKKIWESNFAFQLLPEEFTLTELQKTYEIILHQTLDKRNFRKKILEMKILKPLRKQKRDGAHRPAEVFGFLEKKK